MGQFILIIFRGLAYLYALQPRRFQLFWGKSLGMLLYAGGFRRKIVQQNLERAFLNHSTSISVLKASYEHLGNLILEILLLLGPMKKFVQDQVDVEGLEHIHQAQKMGKGFIFLSSHLGNWEIMAATGGVIARANLMLVTKKLKPEWIHQAVQNARLRCDVKATYEPRTYRDIFTHLKKGGAVGFVLDQYSGAPVGVRVPFLGVPVGTSLALATIVKRTQAIVLPVENYRQPNGRWVVSVKPPLEWMSPSDGDSHHELAMNTAHYTEVLEKMILKHPEQWLWVHRRFKGDLSPLREGEWLQPRVRAKKGG